LIYFDHNNDEDLSNDGPGRWPDQVLGATTGDRYAWNLPIDVPYATGPISQYFLMHCPADGEPANQLRWFLNACRECTIESKGTRYSILLVDSSTDACFDDMKALLLIRATGGSVPSTNRMRQPATLTGRTRQLVTSPFELGGEKWKVVRLSADGTEMTVQPHREPAKPKAGLRRAVRSGLPTQIDPGQIDQGRGQKQQDKEPSQSPKGQVAPDKADTVPVPPPTEGNAATPASTNEPPPAGSKAGGKQMPSEPPAEAATLRCTLEEHVKWAGSVAFSPDGSTLAVADTGGGALALWDVASQRLTWSKRFPNWLHFVLFSPDGSAYVSGRAIGRNAIEVWDFKTKVVRHRLDHNPEGVRGPSKRVRCGAFSRDGSLLATGQKNGDLRVWEAQSPRLLHKLDGQVGSILAIDCHPVDAKLAAVAGQNGKICLWDLLGGELQQTLQGHEHAVNSVAFHPQGHLLASAGDDQTVRLWDVTSGKSKHELQRPENGRVFAVAFDHSGTVLASGQGNGNIALWRVSTGELETTLEAHAAHVLSLAFSPKEPLLASGGNDAKVRLWDVRFRQSGDGSSQP